MLALAVVLFVAGVILLVAGFVLFAIGSRRAPMQRTEDGPTGVKRAASRTPWGSVFRQVPRASSS